MNKKLKFVLFFLLFVALIAGSAALYNNLSEKQNVEPPLKTPEEQNDINEIKDIAPDFTVYDNNGNEVHLSDFKGKPVVINYWASWCSPCKAELPDFDELYNEFKDDVVFLMINATDGRRETKETADKLISEKGYSFDIYYDTKSNAAYEYGFAYLPTTVFIDKYGIIQYSQSGQITKSKLQKEIDELLK